MKMTKVVTINVGKDFSRYPVGRYLADGASNGERFRKDFLIPRLESGSDLSVELDDALGYGSSFLEEAFGGLVRSGYSCADVLRRIQFVTIDDSLREEIQTYVADAARG
jgi:hypothetical protein